MSNNKQDHNPGTAPLRNVLAAAKVMEQLINRAPNMPGLGVLCGPSGYGKTAAACYCANEYRAHYVECRSYFTKKSLLIAILEEMGIVPGKTIYDMVKQIGEQLDLSGRPLIIDEMDHIVDRNLVEMVRDIYEVSQAPILMIGEERFPQKLKRWERFHNRVLVWQRAEPADMGDARKLAKVYSHDVEIADDLLKLIVQKTYGCTRRITVNINNAREYAREGGFKKLDLEGWGDRPLYLGEAPARRLA